MPENTNYASHGNEGVNRTFKRCREMLNEIKRLGEVIDERDVEIERLQRELIMARCAIISDVNQQRDLAEAKRLLRWLLDNMSDGWLPELHETDEWVKQARKTGGSIIESEAARAAGGDA